MSDLAIVDILKSIHRDATATPEAQDALVALLNSVRALWPCYAKALTPGRALQLTSALAMALLKGKAK